jgi:DNA-binding CsgD family transcriptional regulator
MQETAASLDVLRVAAVAGPCSPADLAALTGRSDQEMRQVIAELVRSGEIDERTTAVRFRDPAHRDAIYAELPAPVRASLHHSVGRRLAAQGGPATAVAEHLDSGGGVGEREVVVWLQRAASEVALSDPERAIAYLDRALGRLGPLAHERAWLLAEKVRLLLWVGRIEEAERAANAGLALDPGPATAARLQAGLGEALLLRGRPARALAHLEAALALGGWDADDGGQPTPTADDRRTYARCLAMSASARLWTFDLVRAEDEARRTLDAGARAGDAVACTTALNVRCRLAAFRLELNRAVAFGEEAVRQAGDLPAALRTGPHLYLGLALANADEPGRARELLERGRALCEQLGASWAAPSYANALALSGFFTGDWDRVLDEATTADRLGARTGVQLCSPQIHAICGLIGYHRGDDKAARAAADRAEVELAAPGGDRAGLPYAMWLRALLAEMDGQSETALKLLDAADTGAVSFGVPLVTLWFAPDLVRLALEVGESAVAHRVTERLCGQAPGAGTRSARAVAALCRGQVERDPAALAEAAVGLHAAGRLLDAGRAWEAAGTTYLDTKRSRTQGIRALRGALRAYQQLGAEWHSRRVRAALRAAGARVGATRPRAVPADGTLLTPAEAAVAALVAEGLANAEIAAQLFISKRTVESHVSRIYTKLGITSRVGIARQVVSASGRRDT